MKKRSYLVILLSAALTLGACGGGGSSSEDSSNAAGADGTNADGTTDASTSSSASDSAFANARVSSRSISVGDRLTLSFTSSQGAAGRASWGDGDSDRVSSSSGSISHVYSEAGTFTVRIVVDGGRVITVTSVTVSGAAPTTRTGNN